jgi:hypothetical protein
MPQLHSTGSNQHPHSHYPRSPRVRSSARTEIPAGVGREERGEESRGEVMENEAKGGESTYTRVFAGSIRLVPTINGYHKIRYK